MPYTVPTATLYIAPSFSRLQTLGYANTMIMGDIQKWCVTDTLEHAQSSQGSGGTGSSEILPIVTVVKIGDLNS
jgi:hypothetical protein